MKTDISTGIKKIGYSLKKERAAILLFFFTFLLLLAISSDSYTHYPFPRCDSAWFFMCGKAWMNGLQPYVDFADSKGPLLWLIYGAGYLLSPTSFHGMFWIEVIFYFFTFYTAYRIAKLFLHDDTLSGTVAMLTSAGFFMPVVSNEMRAEDFCQLFFALGTYAVVHLYSISFRDVRRDAAMLGIAFGCCLLIKYNLAMILGFPTLWIFLYLLIGKQSAGAWKFLLYFLDGLAIIVLPISLLLVCQGSFTACVNEYFVNTFFTVKSANPLQDFAENIVYVFTSLRMLSVILPPIIGILLFYLHKDLKIYANFRYLLIWWGGISVTFIMTRSFIHFFVYYFSILGIFWVFLFIFIVSLFRKHNIGFNYSIATGILIICSFLIFHLSSSIRRKQILSPDEKLVKQMNDIGFYMRQIKDPTLLEYNTFEMGEGLSSNALPSSKYWALQNGAIPAMHEEQKKDLLSGNPDFIIINSKDSTNIALIENLGYVDYYHYEKFLNGNPYCLYSKHTLNKKASK